MDNQNFEQPQRPAVAPQKGSNPSTTLCVISLCLYFGAPVLGGILSSIAGSGDISDANSVFVTIISMLTGSSYIAAWVLAIVACAKYKSTFGKVLVIVYSVLLALFVIGVILLVVMCYSIMQDCNF